MKEENQKYQLEVDLSGGSAMVLNAFYSHMANLTESGAEISKLKKETTRKIEWTYKNYVALMVLLELLQEAGYIDTDFKDQDISAALMAAHFQNKGKPISADGVRSYRNLEYPEKRRPIIEKLLQDLNKAAESLLRKNT